MNTFKRILALCLTLLLALPALPAFAAEAEVAYAESAIDLPEGYTGFMGPIALSDGSVAFAAQSLSDESWKLLVYTDLNADPSVLPLVFEGNILRFVQASPDGGYVTASMDVSAPPRGEGPVMRKEGPGGEEAPEGNAVMMTDEVPAEGGEPTLAEPPVLSESSQDENSQMGTRSQTSGMVIMGGGDTKNLITWFGPDGSVENAFEIEGMAGSIAALPGKRLAVLEMMDGITVYGADGNVEKDLVGNKAISIAADDNALYTISMEGDVVTYDAETLQEIEASELPGEFFVMTPFASGGELYFIDSTGLYKRNGAELTKIIDGIGTYFGDPTNGVQGLHVFEDGTVVALIEEGAGGSGGRVSIRIGPGEESVYTLAVYKPMDPSTAANRKTFTVTALRESATLLKAVTEFQRNHPELKVVLDAKMGEYDESPTDDAIRTLNTDLLAGKGGDVLILDGLPVDKYIERGILEDLTEVLSDIEFLPGIYQGSTAADGKIYAMPARFSFETLWGNKDVVASLSALDKLIDTPLGSGQTIMNPRAPKDWLKMFFPASEASFKGEDGKVSFDSPEFVEFLDLIYQLYVSQGEDTSESMEMGRGGISAAEMQAMLNGAIALYPATVGGMMQLSLAYTLSGGAEGGYTTIPSMSGLSRSYTPGQLLGVNARSENPEAAREFANAFFKIEMGEMASPEGGIPTVVSALDKEIEEAIERSNSDGIMTMISVEGGNPLQMEQPGEETIRSLRELLNTLSEPVILDETLLSFIVEETDGFFNGMVDAQAAAQAVEQRAWQYLNE